MKGCAHETRGKSELIKNEWGEKEREGRRESLHTLRFVWNQQINREICVYAYAGYMTIFFFVFFFVCILGLHKQGDDKFGHGISGMGLRWELYGSTYHPDTEIQILFQRTERTLILFPLESKFNNELIDLEIFRTGNENCSRNY